MSISPANPPPSKDIGDPKKDESLDTVNPIPSKGYTIPFLVVVKRISPFLTH